MVWALAHWKDIVIGLVVIGLSAFIASWMMRGAKIDRLKIEKRTIKAEGKLNLQECEEFGEGVAEALREANKIQEDDIRKGKLREQRLQDGIETANALADEEHRRAARIEIQVAARIDAAETVEEKQRVFLQAMQERIDG